MRLSIKKHHDQYLQLIAQQMGTDTTTALDYVLWELKKQGFSFSSQLLSVLPPQAPQAPQIGAFIPYQELAPTQPTTAPTTARELDSAVDESDDEIIRKFAQLLEEF